MQVHQLTVDAAFDSLRSIAQGLTSLEATRRLVEFGPNRIEQAPRVPIALRLMIEVRDDFGAQKGGAKDSAKNWAIGDPADPNAPE